MFKRMLGGSEGLKELQKGLERGGWAGHGWLTNTVEIPPKDLMGPFKFHYSQYNNDQRKSYWDINQYPLETDFFSCRVPKGKVHCSWQAFRRKCPWHRSLYLCRSGLVRQLGAVVGH